MLGNDAPTAGIIGTGAARPERRVTGIDGHAHVFTRGLPLAPGRRYAPDYDATVDAYLTRLDGAGCSHGVLIQPSFLGTDNSHLLSALRRHPDRLKGVVVIDLDLPSERLRDLDAQGVVGIRLNLIGRDLPAPRTAAWRRRLRVMAELGWHVEIQAEARRLAPVVEPLLDSGVTVVIDHFGRPDPALGTADPGFRTLLEWGPSRQVWVKLSGPYRLGPDGARIARAAMPPLRDAFGLDRLVWGSDWPHTQFETVADHPAARSWLDLWMPEEEDRRSVLISSAERLFLRRR